MCVWQTLRRVSNMPLHGLIKNHELRATVFAEKEKEGDRQIRRERRGRHGSRGKRRERDSEARRAGGRDRREWREREGEGRRKGEKEREREGESVGRKGRKGGVGGLVVEKDRQKGIDAGTVLTS